MSHPKATPLEQWPPAWLKLEVASMLDDAKFMTMHEHEKQARGLPVTNEEMRAFIRSHREAGGG